MALVEMDFTANLGNVNVGKILLWYDITQSGASPSAYYSGYNDVALTLTSGAFRANTNGDSDITFTSNIKGTMKWKYSSNSTTYNLYVNGTDVFSQGSVEINVGDTIRWYSSHYWTTAVCWVEQS